MPAVRTASRTAVAALLALALALGPSVGAGLAAPRPDGTWGPGAASLGPRIASGSPTTYPVNFSWTPYAQGTEWTLRTGGINRTTDAPFLVFSEPNGTYLFEVTWDSSAAEGTSVFGNFTVAGEPLSVVVEQVPVGGAATHNVSAAPASSSGSSAGGLGILPFEAGGAIVAVIAVLLGAVAVTRRRRSASTRDPTSVPGGADAPGASVGGGGDAAEGDSLRHLL